MQKEAAYPAEQRAINGCKGTTSKCPLILDQCFVILARISAVNEHIQYLPIVRDRWVAMLEIRKTYNPGL